MQVYKTFKNVYMYFQVTRESRIQRDGRMQIKTSKKQDMPLKGQELMKWVRDRFGAVTSFTEVRQANNIFKTVGKGEWVCGLAAEE